MVSIHAVFAWRKLVYVTGSRSSQVLTHSCGADWNLFGRTPLQVEIGFASLATSTECLFLPHALNVVLGPSVGMHVCLS